MAPETVTFDMGQVWRSPKGSEFTLVEKLNSHDEWFDTTGSVWSERYMLEKCEFIREQAPIGGRKDDQTKPPLHLIAPDFLYAIAEILDFGQKKYAPRNWEKGMAWSRVYRAAIGHLFDWFMRKGPDPETGKSHLWHAACCIMFLVCYEIRNVGEDDRP